MHYITKHMTHHPTVNTLTQEVMSDIKIVHFVSYVNDLFCILGLKILFFDISNF